MMDVESLACTKTKCSAAVLSNTDVLASFATLKPDFWSLNDTRTMLRRTFVCKNWSAAMSFMNELSVIAEHLNHHPDFTLKEYRTVELVIWTHNTGGLTVADFVLAKEIEKLVPVYSPKWKREHIENC